MFFVWLGDQKPFQHQSETLISQCNGPNILPKTQTMATLFTSTPISSRFWTPIFQSKDSKKDTVQCVNLAAFYKDTVSAPDQAVKNQTEVVPEKNPNEILAEAPFQPLALSPVKTTSCCISNQETSVAGPEDAEEEDQSIFYTPELFEGEDEESAAAAIEENKESTKSATEENPLQMEQLFGSNGKMADTQPEELFRSEKGQTGIFAGPTDIKETDVFSKRDNVLPNQDCVLSESVAEQAGVSCSIASENRATQQQHNSRNKSRRLSRTRQKASSTEAGKITQYLNVLQESQPQVIVIDD